MSIWKNVSSGLCKLHKNSISKNLTNQTFVNIIASVAKGNRGKPRIIAAKKASITHLRQTKKLLMRKIRRNFMFKQTHEKELALFVRMAKIEKPKTKDDVPTFVLLPAFILSELKTAFTIGFVVYLPFLVIGFGVKFLFFLKKGFGREYAAGIKNGILLCKKNRKVAFQWKHLPNYAKIQLELWINIVKRLQ